MAKQLAFHVDTSTCTGCKTCQVACQETYHNPAGIKWRRVLNYGGGAWSQKEGLLVPNGIFGYFVSVACNHCETPACVKVCPASAMTKREDGIVSVDQAKCIGCRACETACPYGAPRWRVDLKVMTKCDFCKDLQALGEEPVCVAACPTRSLHFGELKDLRAKYGDKNAIEPLPSAAGTGPALVITLHKNAQASGSGTGRLMNLPEEL